MSKISVIGFVGRNCGASVIAISVVQTTVVGQAPAIDPAGSSLANAGLQMAVLSGLAGRIIFVVILLSTLIPCFVDTSSPLGLPHFPARRSSPARTTSTKAGSALTMSERPV